MTKENFELLDDRSIIIFLAEHYPTPMATRILWERAGGSRADVPFAETPYDLWYELWRKAKTGAAATPEILLGEVLMEYPSSSVLIDALTDLLPPGRLQAAKNIVQKIILLEDHYDDIALIELLKQFHLQNVNEAFLVLAPAFEGEISVPKRDSLKRKLQIILQTIGKGATELYSETVKAAAEGATKALLATHPLQG